MLPGNRRRAKVVIVPVRLSLRIRLFADSEMYRSPFAATARKWRERYEQAAAELELLREGIKGG